jgi:hypothetical protein
VDRGRDAVMRMLLTALFGLVARLLGGGS